MEGKQISMIVEMTAAISTNFLALGKKCRSYLIQQQRQADIIRQAEITHQAEIIQQHRQPPTIQSSHQSDLQQKTNDRANLSPFDYYLGVKQAELKAEYPDFDTKQILKQAVLNFQRLDQLEKMPYVKMYVKNISNPSQDPHLQEQRRSPTNILQFPPKDSFQQNQGKQKNRTNKRSFPGESRYQILESERTKKKEVNTMNAEESKIYQQSIKQEILKMEDGNNQYEDDVLKDLEAYEQKITKAEKIIAKQVIKNDPKTEDPEKPKGKEDFEKLKLLFKKLQENN